MPYSRLVITTRGIEINEAFPQSSRDEHGVNLTSGTQPEPNVTMPASNDLRRSFSTRPLLQRVKKAILKRPIIESPLPVIESDPQPSAFDLGDGVASSSSDHQSVMDASATAVDNASEGIAPPKLESAVVEDDIDNPSPGQSSSQGDEHTFVAALLEVSTSLDETHEQPSQTTKHTEHDPRPEQPSSDVVESTPVTALPDSSSARLVPDTEVAEPTALTDTTSNADDLDPEMFRVQLGETVWRIPKLRLTMQSKYFDRLINGYFQDHLHGLTTVEEDDTGATRCMMQFLTDDPAGPNAPDYRIPEDRGSWKGVDCAMMHAQVFSVGDQYLFPALQVRALEKFRRTTRGLNPPLQHSAPFRGWCEEDQLKLIDLLYDTARAHSNALRNELLGVIYAMLNDFERQGLYPEELTLRLLSFQLHRDLWTFRGGNLPLTVVLGCSWTQYEQNFDWRQLDRHHEQKDWRDVLILHHDQFVRDAQRLRREVTVDVNTETGLYDGEHNAVRDWIIKFHDFLLEKSVQYTDRNMETKHDPVTITLHESQFDLVSLLHELNGYPAEDQICSREASNALIALTEEDHPKDQVEYMNLARLLKLNVYRSMNQAGPKSDLLRLNLKDSMVRHHVAKEASIDHSLDLEHRCMCHQIPKNREIWRGCHEMPPYDLTSVVASIPDSIARKTPFSTLRLVIELEPESGKEWRREWIRREIVNRPYGKSS